MRFFKAFSVVFSFVSLLNAGYGQTTWYVDSRMGNDSFDGSTFTLVSGLKGPFFSIGHALSKASTGDTIAIRAGDYTREGLVETTDKDLSLVIFRSGADQTVILAGLHASHPDGILILENSDQAPDGMFVTDGDEDDLMLHAGTIHIKGGLAIGAGGVVTQTDGNLTGNALIRLDH